MTGRKDDRIYKAVQPPSIGLRVWNLFFDLNSSRQSTGHGPAALTYTEIHAYLSLMGETLEPWEVNALRLMDRAYMDEAYKKQHEGA